MRYVLLVVFIAFFASVNQSVFAQQDNRIELIVQLRDASGEPIRDVSIKLIDPYEDFSYGTQTTDLQGKARWSVPRNLELQVELPKEFLISSDSQLILGHAGFTGYGVYTGWLGEPTFAEKDEPVMLGLVQTNQQGEAGGDFLYIDLSPDEPLPSPAVPTQLDLDHQGHYHPEPIQEGFATPSFFQPTVEPTVTVEDGGEDTSSTSSSWTWGILVGLTLLFVVFYFGWRFFLPAIQFVPPVDAESNSEKQVLEEEEE